MRTVLLIFIIIFLISLLGLQDAAFRGSYERQDKIIQKLENQLYNK